MDERLIVSAILSKREHFDEAVRIGLDATDFNEMARAVLVPIMRQYKRDASLQAADVDLLKSAVKRKYGSKSEMARAVVEYVDSVPPCPSAVNILDEYRQVRLARLSTELATRLATGQHGDKTQELLDQYAELRDEPNGSTKRWRLSPADLDDRTGERLHLYPAILDSKIGGGVLRGHNVTVYGRPESGKSMFALNHAAASMRQDKRRILYVANEEPERDLTTRLVARLIGTTTDELRSVQRLKDAIAALGPIYEQWHLLHRAGASYEDVRAAARDIRPDWIIVDQLKNLRCKEDNRALQLDKLARQVRELGIEFDAATLSVTQAGARAEGRMVLLMDDIEWSSTGIPGAADLMVGIGVTDELDKEGRRVLNLPKNKINGKHINFPVYVYPERTEFRGTRR